jgi:hypothetical protein
MPEAGRPDMPFPVAAASEDPNWLPPGINVGIAHPARVYDYFLGGKDNITQVVSGNPHSGPTVAIQARHGVYSKVAGRTSA